MGTPHSGTQSPDKYKSTNLKFTPQSEAEKLKYLRIYERYSQGALTQDQVGEEFNLCRESICGIIKWVVHYLDSIDPIDAEKERRGIIDRSKKRIRDIDNDLDVAKGGKEKAYLYREARMNDGLIGKASGAMIDNKVNIDNRRIQVVTNLRRNRVKTVKAEVVESDKQPEGKAEQTAPQEAAGPEQERTDTDNNGEG